MYITAICSRYEQVQVIEGGVSRLRCRCQRFVVSTARTNRLVCRMMGALLDLLVLPGVEHMAQYFGGSCRLTQAPLATLGNQNASRSTQQILLQCCAGCSR